MAIQVEDHPIGYSSSEGTTTAEWVADHKSDGYRQLDCMERYHCTRVTRDRRE